MKISKTLFCPHCARLPQFKRGKNAKQSAKSTVKNQAALVCDSICICNSKPESGDKQLECRSTNCESGKKYHLSCLGLKRMPNNSKNSWKCAGCKRAIPSDSAATTCASSAIASSCILIPSASTASVSTSPSSVGSDAVSFVKELKGEINKHGALANLEESDYLIILDQSGCLKCDIIHRAQVLLHEANPSIEGLQGPTLGPVRNFDVVSGEFIQLLHTGSDHWVCISSIGCLARHVKLYDSLYPDIINQEVEEQAKDLLGGSLISINFAPVQQHSIIPVTVVFLQ